MAKTLSTMLPLGTRAPEFSLPDASGRIHTFGGTEGDQGHLVMFICNHCPFVVHIIKDLGIICRSLQEQGISVTAINSNDVQAYPDDSPEKMLEFSRKYSLNFPYLLDESQEIAKAYKAACTPDFFLFDVDKKLVYRGQLDESRPGNSRPVDGRDLLKAVEHLLSGKESLEEQQPSMGCNIKWKPGSEPSWFG